MPYFILLALCLKSWINTPLSVVGNTPYLLMQSKCTGPFSFLNLCLPCAFYVAIYFLAHTSGTQQKFRSINYKPK